MRRWTSRPRSDAARPRPRPRWAGSGSSPLKGPQRVFGLGRRIVRGKSAPMPTSMLPDEIDKTLRKLGSDGDKVRGTLERDFAAYAKQAARDRTSFRNLLLLTVAPADPRARCEGGRRVPVRPGPDQLHVAPGRDPPPRGACRGRGGGLRPDRGRRSTRPDADEAKAKLADDDPGRSGSESRRRRSQALSTGRYTAIPRASGGMADAPALGAGAA